MKKHLSVLVALFFIMFAAYGCSEQGDVQAADPSTDPAEGRPLCFPLDFLMKSALLK